MKRLLRKMILGYKSDSESFLSYYRARGSQIGERTVVYEPTKTYIDITRPWLITIGDDVKITRGVTILTHGYDWSVLAGIDDVVLGSAGRVEIGNNVFIGMNTIILKGVKIGNNVIIGAGSIVNRDVPDNCVIAGVPAKVIMPINQYYDKRKSRQKQEAFEMYREYVKHMRTEPGIEVFDEFFWLFQERDDELPPKFVRQMSHHGRYKETLEHFKACMPEYQGYEMFQDAAREYLKDSE